MRQFFIFILCAILSAAVPCWSAQSLVVSGHPNYPPYMWIQDGELTGIGVELVKTVCQEMNLQCETAAIDSWKRVQEKVRGGEIDILVGAYSNVDRRTYMDYSNAYMQDKTSVIVHKDRTFPFAVATDLIGKRGVTIYGESFGQELDTFIAEKLHISYAYKAKSIFENLRQERADYILWGHFTWKLNARVNGADKWCVALQTPINTVGMYLTFSKQSNFKDKIPEINQIIARLQQNGTMKRWQNQFMDQYLKTMIEAD